MIPCDMIGLDTVRVSQLVEQWPVRSMGMVALAVGLKSDSVKK